MENQQQEQPTQEKKSNKAILIVIVIIVLLAATLGIYLFTKGENENTNTATDTNTATTTNSSSATNTNTTTEADPYADLMQYDEKIIGIASIDGKVTGLVAISIDKTQTMPIAVVNFLKVDDSLPKSVDAVSGSGEAYHYIASHTTADAINQGDGTGALSEAFCNVDDMPDILALAKERNIDIELYRGCDAQYDPWHSTQTFYHVYSSFYNNYTFDYDKIIGKDTLAIFDTAPYYEADEETGGWGADSATVIAQAEPTAMYDLVYAE